MPEHSNSTLSIKRILISFAIFITIPLTAHLVNIFINQYAIALMFSMNIGGAALIIYDWNLFGIHYNRAKYNLMNTIIFTVIGAILIMVWLYIGSNILKANIVIPGTTDLIQYGYARPGMFIAFSFIEATAASLTFKCMTDHVAIHGKNILYIFISCVIFSALFTILFLSSMDVSLFFRTWLYNFILTILLSYLYNQSHTIFPGILAMSLVYFLVMVQSTL